MDTSSVIINSINNIPYKCGRCSCTKYPFDSFTVVLPCKCVICSDCYGALETLSECPMTGQSYYYDYKTGASGHKYIPFIPDDDDDN